MQQYTSLIWIVVLGGFMYLMVFRPQRKQQKERAAMLGSIKKGDRVVTVGGIYGIIRAIKEDRVTLEIASDVHVHFTKAAIGNILRSEPKASKAAEPETLEDDEEIEEAEYTVEQDNDNE